MLSRNTWYMAHGATKKGRGAHLDLSTPNNVALDVLVHAHGPEATADLVCVAGALHGALRGRAVGVEGEVNVSLCVVAPALDSPLRNRTTTITRPEGRHRTDNEVLMGQERRNSYPKPSSCHTYMKRTARGLPQKLSATTTTNVSQ